MSEVSTYLGVKPSTIHSWSKGGGIPHFKIGKMIRFKKEEIDTWVEEHREKGIKVKKTVGALKTIGKPKMDINRIIKKSIDESKGLKYNPGLGNQVNSSIQKGGEHGFV